MNQAATFFRWLGTPFRAVRSWFPFSRDGRITLVYLAFAFAGPALTLLVLWAMNVSKDRHADTFDNLAWMIGASLLIAVSALAVFVSLRQIKLSRDGLDVSGQGGDSVPVTVVNPPDAPVPVDPAP